MSGKWRAEFTTPDGTQRVNTFTFKVDAAVLYYHARGAPPKGIFWLPMRDGRCRIDWPRTNRGT